MSQRFSIPRPWAFSALLVGLAVGCGASTDAPPKCVPGQQSACSLGTCAGYQTCKADGTFAPCECGPSSDAGSVVDASTPDDATMPDGATPGDASAVDAGAFVPSELPGLVLWLDPAKGLTVDGQMTVSTWLDQSGKNNTAYQTNLSSRPLRITAGYKGKDVIAFGGSSGQHLRIDDDVSLQFGTAPYMIAAVIRYKAGANARNLWERNSQGSLVVSLDANVNAVTPTGEAHAFLPSMTFHTVVIRGPAMEIRVDGNPTTGTVSSTDISNPGWWTLIGFCGVSCGDLDMMELFASKGAVSTPDVVRAEAYLKAKYGL